MSDPEKSGYTAKNVIEAHVEGLKLGLEHGERMGRANSEHQVKETIKAAILFLDQEIEHYEHRGDEDVVKELRHVKSVYQHVWQVETCEVCGSAEAIKPWGWDSTPLCPEHWREAWERQNALEER